MRRLAYLVSEAFANIRLNKTTTIMAVATTAFTLACFGVFLLIYINVRGIARSLQEDVKVIIYVNDNLSVEELLDLQNRVKSEREVAAVAYISREQALADFREQFPSEHHLLQGLGENPLPASLVVTMKAPFRSAESVHRWAERWETAAGVAQVHYNQDWIERLSTVVTYIQLAAAAVGTILSAASITIIANTIRLTLYARRAEIDIMRLIGATGAFIKIPYVLEGAMLGALGGAFSLSLLKVGFEVFKLKLGSQGPVLGSGLSFNFFPSQVSLMMVLAGLMLGFAGSVVSLVAFERARP